MQICEYFIVYISCTSTYIHLRNLVTQASSVIYIRLGGILSLSHFLVTYIRLMNLVTQASSVIYIRLGGILSLSHFLVTYIHLRNLVTQVSSLIYIRLGGISSLGHFFGDLHPFKESCHLGFVNDLHSSWLNRNTWPFFTSIRLRNLVTQALSVIYIRFGRILSLSHFFFSDLHLFNESCHLGFVSNLHPSWWNLITWPFFGDLHPFKESCHLLLERLLDAMSFWTFLRPC